jgi:hypothetical protein
LAPGENQALLLQPAINHENHFAHGFPLKNKAPWSIPAILLAAKMSQGAFCKRYISFANFIIAP